MATETEKAYLAGIIDGEGHLHFAIKTDGCIHCYVAIANNRPELHSWLRERWLGGLDNKSKKDACTVTKWSSKENVERILVDALPYLVLKKFQAELILLYFHGSRGSGSKHAFPQEELDNMLLAMEEEHVKSTGKYQLEQKEKGGTTCRL